MSVFNPHRIFIYEKIKDTEIVKKILSQFPSAKIEYIPNQSPMAIRKCEPAFLNVATKNKNTGIGPEGQVLKYHISKKRRGVSSIKKLARADFRFRK